ncbi:xanthine/uracil/vitamin C permease [Oceanobacillus piezotolerans]|uniref:Xanthine/uracil/vitamin C permease n=1 Tax=Oceanobacillus piezotolerans TaxID=2448030 RepID=A0A498DBG0_9BACI|nr:solute carrier family 23 protein [Oceanobacillus piezotolerans]RLL47024.1 xanthine/uracil/vitamin C permease [Oceanobacillus piezotolerans]
MAFYKRKHGEEQPYWAIGSYQLRLPFIHYKLEIPELLQGVVLFTAGLGMIEIMTSVMGISYEAALTITILNQFLMLLPSTFGVPFVSGFITALIPLIVLFLGNYSPGPEAVQAVIAVQIVLAFLFLIFGISGIGEKIVINLPSSLKAGILIGAGIAAIMSEIQPGGRLAETPISITIGGLLCLFTMFSIYFKKMSLQNKWVRLIASFGIMPAIIVAILLGWAVGEYPTPNIEWGITIPALSEVWQLTPFVIGFPGIEMLIAAIPTAILAYIIAYGDIIVGDQMIKRAKESRNDEKIQYSFSQLHILTAIRNLLNALFAPHPGMSGPIYTAGTASVTERYKFGRKAMDSIFSGTNTMLIAFSIGIFMLPFVTFFQPFLPIALSITLILTGYLCITIGMQQVKTEVEMGVAGVMAIVLAIYGAAPALVLGIILYFTIEHRGGSEKKQTKKEYKEKDVI